MHSKYNYQKCLLFLFLSLLFYNDIKSQSFEDGVNYISKIIAEQKYSSKTYNDHELLNLIYTDALNYYNGDISEALLALTFATLPFNKMPVTIPLLDLKLDLRLPSVNQKLFETKRDNIPGNIFFDSPNSRYGDKDKIAHFFGNAFLAYNVSLFNLSKFLGFIVEMFESVFKVSGMIDYRDLAANNLGEFFGNSLRNNENLKVSDFLNVYSLLYFSYN